jgi:Zn finger protein HypA/HybF involved in hydrogenase expression
MIAAILFLRKTSDSKMQPNYYRENIMKYIISLRFKTVKYVQILFLVAILTLSNTAYAELTVTVEPNNRGIISFLSECNIVLSIGSNAEIDLSKLLIKLNGDDVTKEIRGLGKAILSEDKKKLNISYPAHASDFRQGEYTFEVSTTGTTGDKAKLNIQEYKGKAICVSCDSSSRSISDADLNKIIEEETRAVKKAPPKPIVVNGACGSSNGKLFTSQPSSNFCTSGTATSLKGTSPLWTWNCNGANGGRNAVCYAAGTNPVVLKTIVITPQNETLMLQLSTSPVQIPLNPLAQDPLLGGGPKVLQFKAQGKDQNNKDMSTIYTWSVNDTKIGSIDNKGLFAAKAVGTVTVTAASGNVKGTYTVTIKTMGIKKKPLAGILE